MVSKFAGSHKGSELKRNIFPEGRIKPVNEQILLIVDAVNEAINANKKIAFQYYQYNVRKEKKIKNDGDQYIFSPYYLVWNGDYYYMVGYSDKHKNIGSFRIDRICKQPRVLGTDAVPKPEDFDINEYTGVGQHKLSELSDDPECEFVFWVGKKRMFKREKLVDYLSKAYSI